jgi:uncharacterized membrane protein (UPF0136 family)
MQKRKGIGIGTILIIGITLGYFFKNVEIGLVVGLGIGLLAGGLLSSNGEDKE